MTSPQSLKISLGQTSKTGLRERNEDFYACVTPSSDTAFKHKGICAIIADGVGGAGGGMEASQYAVGGFFSDYYSTPDSWNIEHSVSQVINSINSWLYSQGQKAVGIQGLVTTFSMVIFCGRRAHLFHVGDSRIYRIRKGEIVCLTQDHHSPHEGYLLRGVGMDSHIKMDSESLVLEEGDLFLMSTDGLHGSIKNESILKIVGSSRNLQSKTELLAEAALKAGSQDNITSQLIHIDSLPLANQRELMERSRNLRFPPPLSAGDKIDQYEVLGDVATGGMGSLYLAKDHSTGQSIVLKCPSLMYEDDGLFLERFLREEWVGQRVNSPYLMKIFTPPPYSERQFLYLVMEFCRGKSIRENLDNKKLFGSQETAEIGKQICRGMLTFHRLNAIHRDLKPDNIIVSEEGAVKIVDYGIVRLPALNRITRQNALPGSPNYMAPELFGASGGSEQSDIFSLGATFYEMLTGHYPYGEIEESGNYGKKQYKTLKEYDKRIPEWFDIVIEKMVMKKPEERYESISEVLFFLEHPDAVPVTPRFVPLLEKDPLFFWKSCSLILFFLCLVLLFLLLSS